MLHRQYLGGSSNQTRARLTRGGLRDASHCLRVLIVEDDEVLQTALCKTIHMIDSTSIIQWTTHAKEAFDLLRKGRYDLVVSDYLLPDQTTGLWIWERCHRMYPDIPFLLMSGISVDRFLELTLGRQTCPRFLSKPFQPREFREAILGIMDERTQNSRRGRECSGMNPC